MRAISQVGSSLVRQSMTVSASETGTSGSKNSSDQSQPSASPIRPPPRAAASTDFHSRPGRSAIAKYVSLGPSSACTPPSNRRRSVAPPAAGASRRPGGHRSAGSRRGRGAASVDAGRLGASARTRRARSMVRGAPPSGSSSGSGSGTALDDRAAPGRPMAPTARAPSAAVSRFGRPDPWPGP